jgi:hypothetical protein
LTDVLDYLYHPERDGMSFRILYLFLKKFWNNSEESRT